MATRGLALVLVVLALGGLLTYSKYRPTQDRVSGFIEADEIRLGSRVGGRVLKVHIEEGQRVKPGDLLVELEPFNLLAELKRAESTLAARDADLKRLQTGLRTEEVAQALARYERLQAKLDELVAGPRKEEIEAARARLGVAEAQLKLAQEMFRRATRLTESNASTQENLDQATEQLAAAQGSLAAQQEELKLLEIGTRDEVLRAAKAQTEEARLAWELAKQGFRAEEIAHAQAERDAAAAAVDAVKQSVGELEIRSPVGGVIEALELQPGDLAPAGSPTMSIMDDSRLWIRAYVPENRLDIKLGQKMSVTVDSFPDRKFAGALTFISRQAEFTPSNVQTAEERVKQVFRIKVELREGLDLLRAGMAADVWLTDQTDGDAAPAAESAAP